MATLDATARINADEVKEIIDTKLSNGDINAFINSAHRLINAKLAGKGLGDELLEEIEKWLSAHFLAIRDQIPSTERVDKWQATYQGKTDMGLQATTYGQQAMILDTTGTLATLGNKAAVFRVFNV